VDDCQYRQRACITELSYSDQKADAIDVEAREERLVQEREDDGGRYSILQVDKRIVEAHRGVEQVINERYMDTIP